MRRCSSRMMKGTTTTSRKAAFHMHQCYATSFISSLSGGGHHCQVSFGDSMRNFAAPHLDHLSSFDKMPHPSRNTMLWPSSRSFSTFVEPILVRAKDPSRLAVDLVDAVDRGRLDAAWKLYEQYSHMDELPRKSVVTKLIIGLTESFDPMWLDKAYQMVESVFGWKENKLDKHSFLYVAFILARCGMHIAASTILRKMVEVEEYPPLKAWICMVGHMCQTPEGSLIAAELVEEFGYLFKYNRVDPRKKSNRPLLSMKPNSEAFTVVLTACVLFGSTKKAEELLNMMPLIGVKADADLLIVMAHVYERNGRVDEIKKLKRHIDEACGIGDLQFQQFYNSLLACHLKSRDLDSASGLVLDMLRKAKEARKSLAAAKNILSAVEMESDNPSTSHPAIQHNISPRLEGVKWITKQPPSSEEFCKDNNYSRLCSEAKELLFQLKSRLQAKVELVRSDNGILHPTEKIYAKLVKAFLETDRMADLASFLIRANKEETPVSNESSIAVQVINACISLELLEQAHDLLDEMRYHGVRIGSSVYSSLLKAYCKEGRLGEITPLLKDARRAGVQLDLSCYEALVQSRVHQKDIGGALSLFKEINDSSLSRSSSCEFEALVEKCGVNDKTGLMSKLLEEVKAEKRVDYGTHDWNNVIHFFCKKRMMQDAQKALQKMRSFGHTLNAQTFHSLITAYASIGGKYIEVTDLWGEMKLLAENSSLKFDQELLDSLLYCFVRGGFFLRAIEVVRLMERGGMFIDKYKYRMLWLKYHRTLYKGKTPKVQTEAQCERREAALSFKKWLNLT